ncbi:Hint domain-containing protein [Roseobacter sp.]|uniref:Hint domain-containing protein n=1 Tax=Roseobacter sp. TaxID=1907202 RepID=UPI00385AB8D4
MTANLQGVQFDQVYGDNSARHSGEQEHDTDGDGTATQEDEFVSFTNTNGTSLDISGWQIYSDSTGSGAPDTAQDGLYHTFPPGTVLQPGETLFIINEISGTVPDWAQEASEGGVESGAGGVSTNLLTEGNSGAHAESIALVDPDSGDYIVFNMSSDPPEVQNLSGFPGTNNVGTVDGDSVMADQMSGIGYRYDANTDSYVTGSPAVPCFVRGTLILTPEGQIPVEDLEIGDLIVTKDAGALPVRWVGVRHLNTTELVKYGQYPIEFKPGSLGPGRPQRTLRLSPQHRLLFGKDYLMPARGLTDLPKVRIMKGCLQVSYHHLLLDDHHIIFAEGAHVETFLPGRTFLSRCSIADRLKIMRIAKADPKPARECLTVAETRIHLQDCDQAALL